MSEVELSDAEALALAATTDGDTDYEYLTVGQQSYYHDGLRQEHRLLTLIKPTVQLRVFADDDNTFAVRAGSFLDGDTVRTYAGASAQALTDEATNYVYLTAAAALTVNTTGFPSPSATPHVPLAEIVMAAAAITTITDRRPRSLFRLLGGLARAQLAEEALARYQIPLMGLRNENGAVMDAAGGDGKFSIALTGWGTGTLYLWGEEAQNETEVSGLAFEFTLPPEYVASGDVKLVINAKYTAVGTPGTCTIDAEVYELSDAGGASADLCATAAIAVTADAGDKTFTITDADLTPGDRLLVLIRTSIQETANGGVVQAVLGSIEIQLDIKG